MPNTFRSDTNEASDELIHAVCRRGDLGGVKALIKDGVEVNQLKVINGVTPLLLACQEGHHYPGDDVCE